MALRSPAGGAAVGGGVGGASNNVVLFVNPAGILAQDSNFTYTLGTTTLAAPTFSAATQFKGPVSSGASATVFNFGTANTGIFANGTNNISFATAGATPFAISNTGLSTATGIKFTVYDGIAAVGESFPLLVAVTRANAQSAAVPALSTFSVPAADASFEVSANVLVTTATNHTFTVTVAYTDEGNTARTSTFAFIKAGDATAASTPTIVNTNGAIAYSGIPLHIRCKASTSITIATVGTFTTVTYNAEGVIKKTS